MMTDIGNKHKDSYKVCIAYYTRNRTVQDVMMSNDLLTSIEGALVQ